MRAFSRTVGRAATLVALLPPALYAQGSELSFELGGSSVSPPAGVEGDPARFVVAGLRAFHFNPAGTGVHASFLTGVSMDDGTGADFYSGLLEGAAWKHFGGGWSAGLELRGFGFEVVDPFPYRSFGLEGGPTLRFATNRISAALKGTAGTGWSRSELVQYTDPTGGRAIRPGWGRNVPEPPGGETVEIVEDDLWRYGSSLEVLAGSGWLMGGLALGIHESAGGTYRSGGLRILTGGRGRPTIELRVDAWDTPLGSQTTGGLALIVPLDGWNLRGFMGRTEPDPLTLAEPGGGAGGVLLGRRILGRDPLPPANPPLHEILEQTGQEARVRIRVRGPEGAGQLEVLGDFTLWEPEAMSRDGDDWIAEIRMAPGTYHFGFLADGEWYLPADAPDAVPDEWGRRNATLVIER